MSRSVFSPLPDATAVGSGNIFNGYGTQATVEAQRLKILEGRKRHKLFEALSERFEHPMQDDTFQEIHAAISRLGEHLCNLKISDEFVKQMEGDVREHIQILHERQAKRKADVESKTAFVPQQKQSLSSFLADSEYAPLPADNANTQHLRSQSPLPTQDAAHDGRAPSQAGDASRAIEIPAGMDEWTALVWLQQQEQERKAKAVQEHSRSIKTKTQQDLLLQMEERKRYKHEQEENKRRSLERMQEEIKRALAADEQQKNLVRQQQKMTHDMLTHSVQSFHQRKDEEHRKRLEEDHVFLQHMNQRDQLQVQKEQQAKQRYREHMEQVLLDNERQEKLKQQQLQKEREDDARLLEQYTQMLEKQDRERVSALEAIKRRQEALHEMGRHSRSEDRRRELEEDRRRLIAQQEHDRKQTELERQKFENRRNQAVEAVHVLDQQVKQRKDYAEYVKKTGEEEAARLRRDIEEAVRKEREQWEREHQRRDAYRSELDNQSAEHRRQQAEKERMTERERKYHLSGANSVLLNVPPALDVSLSRTGSLSQPPSPTNANSLAPPANGKTLGRPHSTGNLHAPAGSGSGINAMPSRGSPFGATARNMFN